MPRIESMPWYNVDVEFAEYVSVAERRARARKAAEKLARKGRRVLVPVGPLTGNKLVRTFWGKAWCDNLESYSDYASRLPRGRSYARHGAVIDLQIENGEVRAVVCGSSTYQTSVAIRSIDTRRWKVIAAACTGKIDSLVDLLHGKLSKQVMEVVTRKERGLFPAPGEISFSCSCPDIADMCKHVAAVLYGVGIRLDDEPELLFALRAVDHTDLISGAAQQPAFVARGARGSSGRKVIKGADVAALFNIEVDEAPAPASPNGSDAAPDRAAAPPARSRGAGGRPKRERVGLPRKADSIRNRDATGRR